MAKINFVSTKVCQEKERPGLYKRRAFLASIDFDSQKHPFQPKRMKNMHFQIIYLDKCQHGLS